MSRPPASPPHLVGYQFKGLLGTGGFADVFLYQEERPFREVAVKVLLHGLRPEALEHFRAEADLMAKLSNHPSIVSIFTAGQAADGRPYLVMERCREGNLDARLKRRPFAVAKALEIGIHVAGAVETAHRLGILHRDIKPANILFTEFGRPALTDFGISTSGDAAGARAFSTPWAPPEQLASQPTDATGDVYSLGATIWAMLAGHSPFHKEGDNGQYAMAERVRTQPVPSIGRPDVPESLERILRTAMAKEPHRRYASVLEFARALQGAQAAQHLAVTTIDVIEEKEHGDYDDQTITDTRFTTFVEIDPQLAGGDTASGFIDLSDSFDTRVTNLAPDPTGGHTGGTHSTTGGRTGPPILSHGYGALPASGPVDLTGPAVPVLPAERTVLVGALPEHPAHSPEAPTRRRIIPVVLISLVVVGVAGLAVLWVQQGQGGASKSATTSSVAPRPVDAVPETVAKPVDGVGAMADGNVTFTWRNPTAQDGDRFYYRPILLDREVAIAETTTASVSVPAQAGQTCLEVQVVRVNGRASDPTRICVDS